MEVKEEYVAFSATLSVIVFFLEWWTSVPFVQGLNFSVLFRDRKKLTGGRVDSVVLLNGATVLARQRRTSVLSALASAP